MSDIVTYISIGIIIAVFLYFTMEEYKLFKLNETVKNFVTMIIYWFRSKKPI